MGAAPLAVAPGGLGDRSGGAWLAPAGRKPGGRFASTAVARCAGAGAGAPDRGGGVARRFFGRSLRCPRGFVVPVVGEGLRAAGFFGGLRDVARDRPADLASPGPAAA